jgi:hypothetical protein
VTVVNSSGASGSGIEYHLPGISNVHGTPLRRWTFDLKNVSADRIVNSVYW